MRNRVKPRRGKKIRRLQLTTPKIVLMAAGKTFLDWDDLRADGVSYSRAHLYRLIADGRFPQPVRLGTNRVAFVATEYENWKRDRMAARIPMPSQGAAR